jgi:SAM-dependent methyltransferase
MDILGKALEEFHKGKTGYPLLSHSSLGETQELNPDYFFRDFNQMPDLEKHALSLATGNVLDVGCGAGSHSLVLQENGLEVTGLDNSEGAIRVALERGVQHAICEDIENFNSGSFQTILLLMNGAGLAGTLKQLPAFLSHLSHVLASGGQILLDSSDIIYVYESDEDGGVWVPGDLEYYGEVRYKWEYRGQTGPEFGWLFVDFNSLREAAGKVGLTTELLLSGPHYDYLARLTKV